MYNLKNLIVWQTTLSMQTTSLSTKNCHLWHFDKVVICKILTSNLSIYFVDFVLYALSIKMTEIEEAKKKLELSLGDYLTKEYFKVFKQLFLFCNPITQTQFDQAVRKFLVTKDQIRNHNNFLVAFYSKIISPRAKGKHVNIAHT